MSLVKVQKLSTFSSELFCQIRGSEALAKLIELFRRTERYGELVIYTRDRLDQLAIEETPTATLEVFVEAMGKVGREAEVFSPYSVGP